MNLHTQYETEKVNSYPGWMVLLRGVLGLSLFLIGIQFIRNDNLLERVIENTTQLQSHKWMHTFIPWAHIMGGIFIFIGIFTRWAAIVQFLVILAAVLFIKPENNIFFGTFEIPLAFILLLLLLLFIIKGDGDFSWKHLIEKEKEVI